MHFSCDRLEIKWQCIVYICCNCTFFQAYIKSIHLESILIFRHLDTIFFASSKIEFTEVFFILVEKLIDSRSNKLDFKPLKKERARESVVATETGNRFE